MERRQIHILAPEFEERKRQHEERKRKLIEDHTSYSFTGVNESDDESHEILDVDEAV